MIKVGCCGFPTSMKRYFKSYKLVEINSTFYQYPRMETVKGWKQKAPEDFEFTVKAHQYISHKAKLRINEACLEAFNKMKNICEALNAKIMLIQTPGSFGPDRLEEVKEFFKTIHRENITLVWETRGSSWEKPENREKLHQVLSSLDVVHVTDPFKTSPVYTSHIAYFRLHGLGQALYYYQYSDEELRRLKMLVEPYEREGKTVYVLFNNLSMFEDGLRFMHYLSTGKMLKITEKPGLESVRNIIERTRYPASKNVLMKKIGWRLVEIEESKQVRLEELLKELPSKTFKTSEELLKELKAAVKLD
ncbi:DUF72 domain-containing protein [Candidatus Bathyarchaeota archaeon]|nr:DUF72 domain-containing protein [Candidatus Bathyarchaeota archaeon]